MQVRRDTVGRIPRYPISIPASPTAYDDAIIDKPMPVATMTKPCSNKTSVSSYTFLHFKVQQKRQKIHV